MTKYGGLSRTKYEFTGKERVEHNTNIRYDVRNEDGI